MLNQAYDALRHKFSEKHTIREINALFEAKNLDLSVHLESNLPISLAWDLTTNSLTGSCKITVFPKLVISGELYETPFRHDLVMPPTFDGLEAAFLKTLKDSIATTQKVWG
jgi:hypothetical protein